MIFKFDRQGHNLLRASGDLHRHIDGFSARRFGVAPGSRRVEELEIRERIALDQLFSE